MEKKITCSDLAKVLNVLKQSCYRPVVVAVDDYRAKFIVVSFDYLDAKLLESFGFYFTSIYANDNHLEVWFRKN